MAASGKAGEPLRYHLRAFFRFISAASVSTHSICQAKKDLEALVIAMTGGQAGARREVHRTPGAVWWNRAVYGSQAGKREQIVCQDLIDTAPANPGIGRSEWCSAISFRKPDLANNCMHPR